MARTTKARAPKRRSAAPRAGAYGGELARWQCMTRLLELVVRTGHVAGLRPETLVLVGPPGHGKTTLLRRVGASPAVRTYADATLNELVAVAKSAQRGETTHILLPELQRLAMRRGYVAEQAFGFLAAALEEGVDRVAYGRTVIDFQGTRYGMLAAITPDALMAFDGRLKHVGLYSRGLWVPWEMTPDELDIVSDRIRAGDARDMRPVTVPSVNPHPVSIALSKDAAHAAQRYARGLRPHDVRFHKQVIGLAMAFAERQGASTVTAAHVAALDEFRPFFAMARRDT